SQIAFFNEARNALFGISPGGGPVTLVQAGQPIPNTGGITFRDILTPYSFDGSTFAFTGTTATNPTQFGAYAQTTAGLMALTGPGSTLPNASTAFLAVDGDDVAFGGPTAIRVLRRGAIQVVADTSTPQPGTTRNFNFFTGMNYSGGTVVFSGVGGASNGIYF